MPWKTWQTLLHYSFAQTTMVDAAGGRILDKLNALGHANDTLIVWTTDHGDAIASHGGHFDKNAYLTEEILRIPMAVSWPGQIREGQKREDLVSLIDVAPTLLEAAGTGFEGRIDGESMLPMLTGADANWRQSLIVETHGHHGEQVVGRAAIGARYKYNVYRYLDETESAHEMIDLQDDPYELTDVVDREDLAEMRSSLQQAIRNHREATSDPVDI